MLVRVNNGEQLDVMPLVGDFNFYGGIYRDVHLLLTDNLCISPLDYASSGVYLIQQQVTDKQATICARVNLSNGTGELRKVVLRLQVNDGKKTVYETEKEVSMIPHTEVQVENIEFILKNPRLWNGMQDPFMYQAVLTLIKDGKELDKVEQPLGLRYYVTDPDKGFFLNGKHLPLHGVCRHQERAEVGNALCPVHHEEDTRIILDMGVNAVRLAHYPQATYMYDLMDKHGIVTWAEIPFVGPGGYADKGFVDQPSFRENGKEQLKEMIRQHYNHPSICFWGLFNELKEQGDNPVEYIKELNAIAHQEDPTRPTTSASNQEGALNFITDHIAWNRYDGWYGATPATLATWLDATHKNHPEMKIAISEYGAGASIYHQQDSLVQTVPGSWWHPENWQTEYHIQNWKIINERPYVWASFVWNMFDFAADGRDEGGKHGENQKGLVTFDRKLKKDPFYLYKAYWSKEPFVHLCGSRYVDRAEDVTEIKVYSNLPEVSLYKDGQLVETRKGDKVFTFQLPITGKHSIEARSGEHSSVILVNKVDAPNPDYAMDNRKNVTNWFDGELDESCWSVKDNMAAATADPKVGPILKQISDKAAAARGDVAAAVKDNPALVAMMERSMRRMTIESMLMQAGASEEDIKQLNRVLQGISKE